MTFTKPLSYNLKFLRKSASLTQEAMAKKSGLSYRLYQKLEQGLGNPTLHTITKISQAFEVTISNLIQLHQIRLEHDEDQFVEKFKKFFTDSKHSAGIRTTEGHVIWGNKMLQTRLNRQQGHGLDLKKNFIGEYKTLFQFQLECERNGIILPYLSAIPDNDGKMEIKRWYPTLIHPKSGLEARMVAVYMIDPLEDTQKGYYRYCQTLLNCI